MSMRYGIFADIHGNLSAFEAVIEMMRSEKLDGYFCAGDIVGYGANPQGCIDLLQELKAVCVAGNHEWGVLDKLDLNNFTDIAREALLWSRDHVSPEGRTFLSHLPLIFKNEDLMLVHSTLPFPERFEYLTDFKQLVEMFASIAAPVCFVGHTHVPKIYIREGTNIRSSDFFDVEMVSYQKYIVNVGSVGQPRDGNPMACVCIYSTHEKTIHIKRVPYNFQESQRRILEAGLPPFLAERLGIGV